MKIQSLESHFHPCQVGAPRPQEAHNAIKAFCAKFAEALQNHANSDMLLELFAEDGSWTDPVGGPPPYVGMEKLKERKSKLPAFDFAKVIEVFYTVDHNTFLAKTKVKFSDKPNSMIILDKFSTASSADGTMKIKSLESHFHPYQVGAPRPQEAHDVIDVFVNKFATALQDHAVDDTLLKLFDETSGSWTDPVGGPPPYVGLEKLKERQGARVVGKPKIQIEKF